MRKLNDFASSSWANLLMLAAPIIGAIILFLFIAGIVLVVLIIMIVLAYITYSNTPENHPKRWVWVLFGAGIIGFIIWKFWGPGKNAKILG